MWLTKEALRAKLQGTTSISSDPSWRRIQLQDPRRAPCPMVHHQLQVLAENKFLQWTRGIRMIIPNAPTVITFNLRMLASLYKDQSTPPAGVSCIPGAVLAEAVNKNLLPVLKGLEMRRLLRIREAARMKMRMKMKMRRATNNVS